MSLPARTAYVADHGSVTCAVVVESGESAGFRDEVRDIIAEYAAPAAKEAGGMEPTMTLLFWLPKAPVRCIVRLPRDHGSAGASPPDRRGVLAGLAAWWKPVRRSPGGPLVGALVADRVDTIVRRGSGPFEPQVMITEDAVTPTVRLLWADTVSEPLLTLPEAVAWAYDYEFQHPGKKMTDMLADRVRVLGGG